jgi:hypothetical protein
MRLAATKRGYSERHKRLLQRVQVVSAKGEVKSALLERGIGHEWTPPVGQHFSHVRDIGAQCEKLSKYLANVWSPAAHEALVTDRREVQSKHLGYFLSHAYA